MPFPEQEERIRRLGPRFRTDSLFVLLHGESRRWVREDPRLGRELAELAVAAAETIDPELTGRLQRTDLAAEAWAWLGNRRLHKN